MAYDKYDPRIDSLVMETRTLWEPSLGSLAAEDKTWLARMVHQTPQAAKKIAYERTHTGFAREITVTADDVARIYQQRLTTAG